MPSSSCRASAADREARRRGLAKAAEAAPDGWACWAFSNHDVVRHASRWNLTPAARAPMITLLMCLRGSVCSTRARSWA
jgi:glycosidase